jgi:hypothetical protein
MLPDSCRLHLSIFLGSLFLFAIRASGDAPQQRKGVLSSTRWLSIADRDFADPVTFFSQHLPFAHSQLLGSNADSSAASAADEIPRSKTRIVLHASENTVVDHSIIRHITYLATRQWPRYGFPGPVILEIHAAERHSLHHVLGTHVSLTPENPEASSDTLTHAITPIALAPFLKQSTS